MSENGTIKVRLPDGSELEAPRGASVREIAERIGPRLAKAAYAAAIDGRVVDLSRRLESDAAIRILTERDPETLEVYRHSTAHLMAQAVQRLWPGTKVTIGPVIEDGFFYDFERDEPFTPEDFAAIEAEMDRIVMEDYPIEREEISREDALALFRELDEPYKVEIIEDLPEGETLTIYRQGDWLDLCRGPHVPSTGRLGTFKLLSAAGAYWRGDERNRMLTRIYGTAFFKRGDLEEHLARIEEAKRRDHRKLGKELDLYSFHPNAPASPYFHPKGAWIYNRLQSFMRELYADGWPHDEIVTPQIYDVELWHISGHYENYKENMFFTGADEREMAVKPMNCPASTYVYAAQKRSYRDLPLRYADFGRLHRYEKSGVVTGLFRVRTFVQDDAHIFCRPDQIQAEVTSLIRLVQYVMEDVFGFEVGIDLSLRGDKRIGSDEAWDIAEDALRQALVANGLAVPRGGGGGGILRAQDRLPGDRRAGAEVAAVDDPVRLQPARAVRPALHDPRWHRGAAGRHPPGDPGFDRALHGDPRRALRRRVPDLARAGAGADRAGERHVQRVRPERGRAPAARRHHARTWTSGAKGWGTRSGTPRCTRSRTCSSSARRRSGRRKVSVRSHAEGELGQMDLDHFVSRLRDEAEPPAPRKS